MKPYILLALLKLDMIEVTFFINENNRFINFVS